MIVARGFEGDARFNAGAEGVALSLSVLPTPRGPQLNEIQEMGLGEQLADQIIAALSQRLPPPVQVVTEEQPELLRFSGVTWDEAVQNMEKHFLQHCWSDGLPLVPPTEEAVHRMLEGTDLAADHVVAVVEPGRGKATVEKIAINAVMAGCLPQYLPVILAAVEALTDPRSDLRGVQCTAGLVSPLLIASGPKLIEQLNINDSFSTIGPGWRANATIGRSIRLIMINLGHSWPGKNDMKPLGSPFKYVTLMAENESGYGGFWEPIRVAEGFTCDQPTLSVMPTHSWQVDVALSHQGSLDKLVELLTAQARAKYDKTAQNWGMDNLILINPTLFEFVRKARKSRSDLQRILYEAMQVPCRIFFEGMEPKAEQLGPVRIPDWLVERGKADPEALAPLVAQPESLKIVVAGGMGVMFCAYISTWGYGPAYFVTRAVKFPRNWEGLLRKYEGWNTPVVKEE